MAKSMVTDTSALPSNAALVGDTSLHDLGDPLPTPPMDPIYFSQNDEMLIDDLDFDLDFDFDDLNLPCDVDSFLDPNFLPGSVDQDDTAQVHHVDPACYLQPGNGSDLMGALNNSASELSQFSDNQIDGNAMLGNPSPPELSSSGSRVLNSDLLESHQIYGNHSGNMNVPSPESNGSNQDGNQGSSDARDLSCPSPESQGSGNWGSNISAAPNSLSKGLNQSVSSSPGFGQNSIGVVDHNLKSEEMNNILNYNNSVLKRKKEDGESNNVKLRMNKCRKPIDSSNTGNNNTNTTNVICEEEEKKKARLLRNRESAHLSRQRKKHYVEELEGKVRTMHSTIQELNAKISYIMAENASLRQQMGGSGLGVAPSIPPPPPGMYAPVMYPWMPFAPPYMVKPQGSQVPLVPIPKLNPQKSVSVAKTSKKVEGKKKESRIKKVASVSILGFLFFIFMFGALVPMVNVRHGGMEEAFMGGNYAGNGFYEKHHRSVLAVNGSSNSVGFGHDKCFSDSFLYGKKDQNGGEEPHIEHGEIVCSGNVSEPLAASLYVPRNDKLVKIDGNLIIHSVLASEKAMASRGSAETKSSEETGLAIPGNLAPARRHTHMYQGPAERQRALGPGTIDSDSNRLTGADGRLQQWFQEGLSGPMLSSGMCTEVFQFDVSSAIIPATSTRNASTGPSQNTTNSRRGKYRRILHNPIPISTSSKNMSEENFGSGHKENVNVNNTMSPMIVSVLVDPREVGDGESMMGTKSLSRIFVVVLIDSVKYVTYSCMLPFKGSVLL